MPTHYTVILASVPRDLIFPAVVALFFSLQIKADTKRPVYCSLIRLLQDKNLSVKV